MLPLKDSYPRVAYGMEGVRFGGVWLGEVWCDEAWG